jgi:hypothetical protein
MRHILTSLPLVFTCLLATIGCGSATPPAGEPHEPGHDVGHSKLSGPLKEFHDVLAPLWHADKGPEREKKTCAAIATFEERAAAVKDEPMIAAVGQLKAECGKAEGARSEFDAKFGVMHEAFHRAAEKPAH